MWLSPHPKASCNSWLISEDSQQTRAGINGDDDCKGQQEGRATSPSSAKPPHRITLEFTDHAARTQKKWCLIMVYIKLNVILNIGLQIPDDLFSSCQSQQG